MIPSKALDTAYTVDTAQGSVPSTSSLFSKRLHVGGIESVIEPFPGNSNLHTRMARIFSRLENCDREIVLPIVTVTCAHCVGNQPIHKGYTPWTWALESVKHQGDDIILVVGDKIYKLQGNPDEILKYIADKATVTGHLDGNTLSVEMIGKPGKGAWNNLSPAVKGLAAA